MTSEEEIIRAGRAKEILDNELFREAVSDIEAALKQGRMGAPATATDLRDKLWAQEVALHVILEKLRTHIETGQLAEEEIRRRTLKDRLNDFVN